MLFFGVATTLKRIAAGTPVTETSQTEILAAALQAHLALAPVLARQARLSPMSIRSLPLSFTMAGPAMKYDRFPPRIRSLEPFSERFEAFRLAARGCDVLFASYPAGTRIEAHVHDTENWGVITRGEMILTVAGRETRYAPGDWYHIASQTPHAARCLIDTEEIEFWFTPEGAKS